jgi:hypothetical protein
MNELTTDELAGVLAEAYGRWQDDDEATGSMFSAMAEAAAAALKGGRG